MGRAKGSKNPNAGNKPLYDELIKPKFDYIEEQLKRGATQKQIAESLGIKYATWNKYKYEHPEFKEFVNDPRHRQALIENLKGVLVTSAEGHSRTITRHIKLKEVEFDPITGKKIREVERLQPYEEEIYFPPNITALFGALNIYDKTYVKDRANYEIKKRELALKEKQAAQNDFGE